MSRVVEVKLWGTTIGYLGYHPGQTQVATFEYTQAFQNSGIEISPIAMPLNQANHQFSQISQRTFKGIPGVFADSLPDKYGDQIIDLFFSQKSVASKEITTLDRLLYVHNRTIGALSYHPDFNETDSDKNTKLDLQSLAELSAMVLRQRGALQSIKERADALKFIRVSASAGGARAKALIATNRQHEILDGTQLHTGSEHRYWLLKFDNEANQDRDGTDPKGMTKVEYVYTKLAKMAGINVPEIDYLTTGNDFHFMIERFDRYYPDNQPKVQTRHYASWCGLSHYDRDTTGSNSYEQLVQTMRKLNVPARDYTEIFKRAVFNIISRNQDDHTKNFGFIMDRIGQWQLSPAFDLTYAYNPTGAWTKQHQIRLNLKQADFERNDLLAFAKQCEIKTAKANHIIDEIISLMATFEDEAKALDVNQHLVNTITQHLRLSI